MRNRGEVIFLPDFRDNDFDGAAMKTNLLILLITPMLAVSAWSGNAYAHGSPYSGSIPTANSSSSSATGGAGGSGGAATGGSATGGMGMGGAGGSASGGASNVNVNVSNGTAGSGGGPLAAQLGEVGDAGSSAYNTKATVDYGGSYRVKNVPSVLAPSLTATLSDTCMGSVSAGISAVGFGVTGGTTMVDEACVRRLDSREFRAMGMNDVALALLCQGDANRKAIEATGRSCPGEAPKQQATATTYSVTASPSTEQYTDPIIRRRLGLPPLPN